MSSSAIRGALLAALAFGAAGAAAQAGFETLDPSYGGETARRGFYGGFAVSGEAAFRNADPLSVSVPGTPTGSDLALTARLDYVLLPQVDLALVADLTGGVRRGAMGVSWVVVKPYWHSEMTDYAVRVAVDPASEGGLGFRQTDVTFLSTTAISPTATYDFSVGLRRVRTGYSTAPVVQQEDGFTPPSAPVAGLAMLEASPDPERVRLVGQEFRISWDGNALFDPAGSRITFGMAAEASNYTLVRTRLVASEAPDGEAPVEEAAGSDRIWGGIGWIRTGLEFSRPSYQLAPFASLPVLTLARVQGEPVRYGPRASKVQFGLRVTLR